MDEKNCVAGFYVQLSPEATAKLPLSETKLRSLVRTYRYFPIEKALKVLFYFNYGTQEQKKEAIEWFNIVLEDNLDKLLLCNEEEFRILANELCIQYQANHPTFLDINSIADIPNNCEKELATLKEKMVAHPVLLFRTVELCVLAHKKDNVVSRCVLQLLSTSTADDTIALESLGFKFQYRIYLLPFAKEIGMLLFAMHQSYLKKQQLLTIQDVFTMPLIELLKKMKMIQQDMVNKQDQSDEISFFETEALKFIESSSNVNSDDSQFKTFTQYRQKLENLGQSIITLMYANIALSEVELSLRQSNSEFSGENTDGILLATVINFPLAKKMLEAETSYNKAKSEYCLVSEDLQTFINMLNKTP